MKKWLQVSMVTAVSGAVLLAGCSGKTNEAPKTEGSGAPKNFNAENYPIVNDKITLNMMGAKAAIHGPWNEMALFKEMEKMTNIHFEFNTPPAANYQEAKNLAFASRQLPDVFFNAGLTPDDEVTYGSQGYLIPLEGLIEKYAPNFKKRMEANPDIKKSITAMDGHIYSLPLIIDQPRAFVPNRFWINGEWMESLGITKVPQTTDELYELLKAFKNGDPNKNGKADEIPMSNVKLNNFDGVLLPAFGLLGREVEVKDGKVRYNPVQPNYKEYLAYLNKLFSEKLLDGEMFVQTSQQMAAKGNSNQLGVFAGSAPDLVLKVAKPEDNLKHPMLGPLTSPVSSEKLALRASNIRRGTFAITNQNKNPEATIRWVDYLYSDEGSRLGFLGNSYKWLDDAKTKWTFVSPEGVNAEEYRGKLTPDVGGQLPLIKERDFDSKRDNGKAPDYNKMVLDKLDPFAKRDYPDVYFSNEEQKRLNVVKTDIKTYVDQMEAKFIVGQEPLTKWDDYVNTIKKMGLDEMLKIYQDAYDRWNKTK
ncbi:extracellular solute-binding protein [Paenibacillus ginsengarvi]|uniref:Extracellular solute-binding protein n=1 Tax=Paenibacillus ginsengarvi TaxID=400777 RepID=A0A3B0CLS8_9BACL|nr:extracellular solute-binding protein [Paenibacillus ginsengarvi]RKN85179.1 extracellular solute-binding protein [Paenibacillus ginsengarvi]